MHVRQGGWASSNIKLCQAMAMSHCVAVSPYTSTSYLDIGEIDNTCKFGEPLICYWLVLTEQDSIKTTMTKAEAQQIPVMRFSHHILTTDHKQCRNASI